ncbi:MAG: hypothetical protein JO028_06015 [Acidobacteriaceae bacterium]|nr:hypothetical protein [Acidobacteriaceae bacterium]
MTLPFCIYFIYTVPSASAQYLNVTEGQPIRYNDTAYNLHSAGYTGKWDNGDTHASAWMNDGNELITYNDGTMPIPVSITGRALWPYYYSNIGLDVMPGGGDYTSLTGVNAMADYGTSSQINLPSGWTDDRTWKTSGIAPYNGCVYLTVQRQEDYDTLPGGGVSFTVNNGFRNGSSSIVKSCDHGATWVNSWNNTPSYGGNPPPANQQMWRVGVRWYANASYSVGDYVLDTRGHNQVATHSGITGPSAPSWNATAGGSTVDGSITWTDAGPAIAGFVPVTYCQDNTISCPTTGADGFTGGAYIYLTAIGAGDTGQGSYANYYLARVLKTDFPSLDVTKYQYWKGSPGGLVSDPSNWSNSMVGAQPIINVTGMRSQVYYLAGVHEYLLIHDTAHGTFEFWIATSLAGPWIKTGYTVTSQDFAEFPSLLMSTVHTTSSDPAQVSFLIEYGGCAASDGNEQDFPVYRRYSSAFKVITLTESSTSAVTAGAAAFTDSIPRTGLIADLAFLPELGNTITDYSGAGHTAVASYTSTPNTGSNYSTGGIWFNASNPGNDVLTGSYKVTVPAPVTGPFTLFVAYRKLQQPQNNECIVSGSQISICRNGLNADDWLITVNGATTEWSDGSTYNGAYYSTGWDGSWNMFIVMYNGTTVNTYNQYTLFSGNSPVISLRGSLAGSNFTLGGNNFSGEIARFVLYNRAMETAELQLSTDSIISDLKARNIYLTRPVRTGEYVLDSQGVPLAAWSVRRVLSSWTGPLLRLHSLSLGTDMDIPSDFFGNLDSSVVNSFCGLVLTNCIPTQLYDQTGKGNTLTVNSLPAHHPVLTTCGSRQTYCIYQDGYSSFATPSNFFFYGFTGGVSAVMGIDQTHSGPNSGFLTYFDGIASPRGVTGLLSALEGDSTNQTLSWERAGFCPPGVNVSNMEQFVAFSWFDSYLEHFLLNLNYAPNATVSLSHTQVRFQTYGFSVGSIGISGGPYGAGSFSEVFLWDQALSAGHVREIGRSESAYFGTPYIP